MRRDELESLFSFAGDYSVYLVVDVNVFQEVFADVVQKFVQITVVIINIACIWRMVAVFLQNCKSDTIVDA